MDNTFFHILAYFVIYSFLGWVLESIVRTICERKIINTGFLIGPFCPIYGFGAIIMILFLDGFKNNILLLFFISVIVLTLWEYVVGVLLEKLFHTKYWDYSDHKFNYKGRICLTNSIAWGILGVLFINYIHPFIIRMLSYIDFIYVAVIACVIAFSFPNGTAQTFEGRVDGTIVSPQGADGFGFDPIFRPNGYQETFAQLPAEQKNKISHRAKAVSAFLEKFQDFIGK